MSQHEKHSCLYWLLISDADECWCPLQGVTLATICANPDLCAKLSVLSFLDSRTLIIVSGTAVWCPEVQELLSTMLESSSTAMPTAFSLA